MVEAVEPAVFRFAQAALYLNIGHDELRKHLQTGRITGWKSAGGNRGDWRVSKAACDEWIKLQEERGRLEVSQ